MIAFRCDNSHGARSAVVFYVYTVVGLAPVGRWHNGKVLFGVLMKVMWCWL